MSCINTRNFPLAKNKNSKGAVKGKIGFRTQVRDGQQTPVDDGPLRITHLKYQQQRAAIYPAPSSQWGNLGNRYTWPTKRYIPPHFPLPLSLRVNPHRGWKTRRLCHRRPPWARGSRSPRATATGARRTSRGRSTSCLRETTPRPAAARRRRLLTAPRWWWSWKVRGGAPAGFIHPNLVC